MRKVILKAIVLLTFAFPAYAQMEVEGYSNEELVAEMYIRGHFYVANAPWCHGMADINKGFAYKNKAIKITGLDDAPLPLREEAIRRAKFEDWTAGSFGSDCDDVQYLRNEVYLLNIQNEFIKRGID